jgi:hypothetical protein
MVPLVALMVLRDPPPIVPNVPVAEISFRSPTPMSAWLALFVLSYSGADERILFVPLRGFRAHAHAAWRPRLPTLELVHTASVEVLDNL